MYDVAIIGSGYGGSVMAARLAEHGRVIVLERGKRWEAGDFPTTLRGIAGAYMTTRNPLGLWSMRLGAGTGNAFASGVGGASLVNYGATSRPEDYTFDDWPLAAWEIAAYYARALEVLHPSTNPLAATFGDQQFIDEVEPGHRVDIRNTIDWQRCTNCGHCVPGCNYRAKRSLTTPTSPLRWSMAPRFAIAVKSLMWHRARAEATKWSFAAPTTATRASVFQRGAW
jgi:cholesterol oxidase